MVQSGGILHERNLYRRRVQGRRVRARYRKHQAHDLPLDLTSKAIDPNDLSAFATQHRLADAWTQLVPSFSQDRIHVVPSIEHAVRIVRSEEDQGEVEVLVAGSLHLVGGVMEVAGVGEQAIDMS